MANKCQLIHIIHTTCICFAVYKYQVEVYTGEQFRAGTDAKVSVQIYGERGDTGLRRLMDSKTNTDKFEGGEVSISFYSLIFYHNIL